MNNREIKQLTRSYHKNTNDNINGVFYGYKIVEGKLTSEKGVVFMVNEKKPLSELKDDEIIPKTIQYKGDTLVTDVVESKPELSLICHYCNSSFYEWENEPSINNNLSEYAIGGIGLYNVDNGLGVGTLGFIAVDNDTDSVVGITNSHVALSDPLICSERNPTLQIADHYDNSLHQGYFVTPTVVSSYDNFIGKVKKYVPLSSVNTNQVDGTAIAIDQDRFSIDNSWKIVGLDSVIPECMEFATTEELDDILNTNPDLYSSGIKTGIKGLGDVVLKPYAIDGNLTTTITLSYYTQQTTKNLTFNNVHAYIAVEPSDPSVCCFFPANRGDSGSAVLARIPIGGGEYKTKIIGLLFAVAFYGDLGIIAYFNRIDDVAEQLNIRAIDSEYLAAAQFSDLNNLESCVIEGLSSEKFIIKDGKKYWQVGLTRSTDICQPD